MNEMGYSVPFLKFSIRHVFCTPHRKALGAKHISSRKALGAKNISSRKVLGAKHYSNRDFWRRFGHSGAMV